MTNRSVGATVRPPRRHQVNAALLVFIAYTRHLFIILYACYILECLYKKIYIHVNLCIIYIHVCIYIYV